MLFSFSKEFIPAQRVDGFGVLFGCRLFRVFAGGEPVGQYFGHKDVSFFAYGDTDAQIDHQGYNKKVPRTKIFHRKTGTLMGKYQRRETELVPKGKTFARLWLGEMEFEACELKPEQSREKRIKVYNGTEDVEFVFGYERWNWKSSLVSQPITDGVGILRSTNLALLFGGICLLEEFTDLASFRVTIGD